MFSFSPFSRACACYGALAGVLATSAAAQGIGPTLSREALRAVILEAAKTPWNPLVIDQPLNRSDPRSFLAALTEDLLTLDPAHRPGLSLAPGLFNNIHPGRDTPHQLRARLLQTPVKEKALKTLPETRRFRQTRRPLPNRSLPLPRLMILFDSRSKATLIALSRRLKSLPTIRPVLLGAGLSTGDLERAARLSADLGQPVMALPDALLKALALNTLPADIEVHPDHLEVTEWCP